VRAGASGKLFFDLRSCAPAEVDEALHWRQVQGRWAKSRLGGLLIVEAMAAPAALDFLRRKDPAPLKATDKISVCDSA